MLGGNISVDTKPNNADFNMAKEYWWLHFVRMASELPSLPLYDKYHIAVHGHFLLNNELGFCRDTEKYRQRIAIDVSI